MCFAQTNDAFKGFLTSVEDKIKKTISRSTIHPDSYIRDCFVKEKLLLKTPKAARDSTFETALKSIQDPIATWKAKEADAKHQLRSLNVQHAWFLNQDRELFYGEKETKKPIDLVYKQLIQTIYRHVIKTIKFPDFSKNLWPKIDQRKVKVQDSKHASYFPQWLHLSTLLPNTPIDLPLQTHKQYHTFLEKAGKENQALTVQLQPSKNWRNQTNKVFAKTFGVTLFVDFKPYHAITKEAYAPYLAEGKAIAIDKGLAVLMATDLGDLLGRDWMKSLGAYDQLFQKLHIYRQKHFGVHVQYSAREKGLIARVRGYIKTRINQILNRLVETHHPAMFIFENANFYEMEGSSYFNRIVRNMGEQVIKEKLASLELQYGITSEIRDAAYTSQQCDVCGYIDARNRPSQKEFSCLFCGHTCNADVGGARVLKDRRSIATLYSTPHLRKQLLLEEIKLFQERHPIPLQSGRGRRQRACGGLSRDPRLTNPYFQDVVNTWQLDGVILSGEKEGWHIAEQYTFPTLQSA